MSSATLTTPSIGVIICSTRQPRFCPQAATFVTETYEKWTSSLSGDLRDSQNTAQLHLIDLAEWNLPLFDEPNVPSQITRAEDYGQPHTRTWSLEVQKYSAFIFVTPQYNWGYPAVVKNAIDYLYHEWGGKPAMIVSYGGHGGGKSADQLRQVLYGVRMTVAETMPALTFPSKQTLVQAAKGQQLPLSGDTGIWEAERKNICKAFEELMALVSPQ